MLHLSGEIMAIMNSEANSKINILPRSVQGTGRLFWGITSNANVDILSPRLPNYLNDFILDCFPFKEKNIKANSNGSDQITKTWGLCGSSQWWAQNLNFNKNWTTNIWVATWSPPYHSDVFFRFASESGRSRYFYKLLGKAKKRLREVNEYLSNCKACSIRYQCPDNN